MPRKPRPNTSECREAYVSHRCPTTLPPVVDKDGNPIVGRPIILCQDILFPQLYFGQTDKNGEFTVRVNRSAYIAEIGGAGYKKMLFPLDMMRDYEFEQPLRTAWNPTSRTC